MNAPSSQQWSWRSIRIIPTRDCQATKVIAWLGTAGDAARDIAELLAAFSNMSPKTFDALAKGRLKLSLFDFENEDILEKHGLPRVPIDKWRSLVSFFDRAWFSRLWVIQEFALAGDVEFWSGEVVIPASAMMGALSILQESGLLRGLGELSWSMNYSADERIGVGTLPLLILCLRDFCHLEDPETGLRNWIGRSKDATLRPEALFDIILSVTSPFRSTDPRDKVFAVLAMIDQLLLSLKQNSLFIRVDYTMPVVEVYYKAAKAIVNGTQSLALLSRHIDAPTCELIGLPSWVPDFSTHRGVPMMNVNWTQETTKFNAALNNSTRPPSFTVDDMLLTCNCHRPGIVEDVGEPVHDMFSKSCFEESAKLMLKQEWRRT